MCMTDVCRVYLVICWICCDCEVSTAIIHLIQLSSMELVWMDGARSGHFHSCSNNQNANSLSLNYVRLWLHIWAAFLTRTTFTPLHLLRKNKITNVKMLRYLSTSNKLPNYTSCSWYFGGLLVEHNNLSTGARTTLVINSNNDQLMEKTAWSCSSTQDVTSNYIIIQVVQ